MSTIAKTEEIHPAHRRHTEATYLHALRVTNNIQHALLRIQEICAESYRMPSAFTLLPAYYFRATATASDKEVAHIIGSRAWMPLSLEGYRWHNNMLLLGVAPHPLLHALCAADADGHRQESERLIHICKTGSGFLLCYGTHALPADTKKSIIHALPKLAAARCSILQYILCKWRHGASDGIWESSQKIIAKKWINLRN